MKNGQTVTIKETGKECLVCYVSTSLGSDNFVLLTEIDGTSIKDQTGGFKSFLFTEVSDVSDIVILPQYEKKDSDIIFQAEDSNGQLSEVFIPAADIANFFDVEEVDIKEEEEDYQNAAQNVFDTWTKDKTTADIEIQYVLV